MRYVVFAYDWHYPSGGVEDIVHETNDLEAAINKCREYGTNDNAYVYDFKKCVVVWDIDGN